MDVRYMLLEVGMLLSEAELSHRKVLVEVVEAEVVEAEVVEAVVVEAVVVEAEGVEAVVVALVVQGKLLEDFLGPGANSFLDQILTSIVLGIGIGSK